MRLLLLSFAFGCTGGADTCEVGGDPVSLDLTVDAPDLAWTATPQVRVYDADGALVAMVAPGDPAVDGLIPGAYTLVSRRGTAPDAAAASFADLAYGRLDQTVETICLSADTELTVGYEAQPSAGHLFVTSGERIAGFQAPDGGGANVAADIRLDLSLVNGLNAIAFDPMGNLWAATQATYGARLQVFAPGHVQGVGPVDPDFELLVPEFENNDSLTDLVFTDDGGLWVSVAHDDDSFVGLYQFSAAQVRSVLLGEALDAPAKTWTVPGLLTPSDLALSDDDSALWIADFDQNAVVRVSTDGSGGSLTPTATVEQFYDADFTTPYGGPSDLLVDADGALWVAWWTSASLTRLDDPQDGPQQPDFEFQPDSLALIAGLSEDLGGGLWYGVESQAGMGALNRVLDGAADATLTSADSPTPGDVLVDPAP